VLDDGATGFDLAQSKYSISGEHNKCLLHLWSAERNLVRRLLDVEIKHEVLRLALQGLGQTRPGNWRFAGSGTGPAYFSGHIPSTRRTSTSWAT
jgi:hypothetical protein